MMIFIISVCAFIAALLTLYSGFGLGTLLMPVIAVFLPVPIAIAITAFVHLVNNIFKLILLTKHINWRVTFKFGLPAIIATIPGAWLLHYLADLDPLVSYYFFDHLAIVTPIKLIVGCLLLLFATIEWHTANKSVVFNSQYLPVGGLLSGFFGGLSGQQGAFRTAFILHAGLSKEQFVGTNASIAVLVDSVRLMIYSATFHPLTDYQIQPHFLFTIVFSALLGSILGVIGLKKITFVFIQRLVITLLYMIGTLLLLGII